MCQNRGQCCGVKMGEYHKAHQPDPLFSPVNYCGTRSYLGHWCLVFVDSTSSSLDPQKAHPFRILGCATCDTQSLPFEPYFRQSGNPGFALCGTAVGFEGDCPCWCPPKGTSKMIGAGIHNPWDQISKGFGFVATGTPWTAKKADLWNQLEGS